MSHNHFCLSVITLIYIFLFQFSPSYEYDDSTFNVHMWYLIKAHRKSLQPKPKSYKICINKTIDGFSMYEHAMMTIALRTGKNLGDFFALHILSIIPYKIFTLLLIQWGNHSKIYGYLSGHCVNTYRGLRHWIVKLGKEKISNKNEILLFEILFVTKFQCSEI